MAALLEAAVFLGWSLTAHGVPVSDSASLSGNRLLVTLEIGIRGASQFLAELFFSLAPGFSRVNRARRKWERFQPFSAPAATKPLKRLGAASPAPTGLKPGANEKLQ